jgi:hypothetical protein
MDRVSYTQMARTAGMSKSNVARSIDSLAEKNMLIKQIRDGKMFLGIQKDHRRWNVKGVLEMEYGDSTLNGVPPVLELEYGAFSDWSTEPFSDSSTTIDNKDTLLKIADSAEPRRQDADEYVPRETLSPRDLYADRQIEKFPNHGWNQVYLKYRDRFGHLPTWRRGEGMAREMNALQDCRNKVTEAAGADTWPQVVDLYFADAEEYLRANGHRPSLLAKRIDGYLSKLVKPRPHRRRLPPEPEGESKKYHARCLECGEYSRIAAMKCPACGSANREFVEIADDEISQMEVKTG